MSHALIDAEELWLEQDVAANDVCLAPGLDDELYVAWGAATLQREAVHLARWRPGQGLQHLHTVEAAFRPQLVGGGTPLLACCRLQGRRLEPLVLDAEGRPLDLPVGATAHQVALAAAGHGVWVAWSGPGRQIVLGRAAAGRFHEIGRLHGTAPALQSAGESAWLAWSGEGGLRLATLGEQGVVESRLVAAGDPADPPGAPALAADSTGACWLCWHEPLGQGTLRWLGLARGERRCSPRPGAAERDSRAEDQGWEFPALVADARDRVWLAGRSSNGFHLQVRTERGWTPRVDLSGAGWSNRSRSCGLARLGSRVVLARGMPAGLRLTALTLVGDPLESETPEPARFTPRRSRSPAVPAGWPPVLFGDLHQHSVCSDGTGEPERAYLRARHIYGHDVFALTDHEKLGRRCLGPVTWRYQCELADAFYRPGELVTLRAYEFTGARLPGPGHKCVYFGETVPDALPEKNVEALWAVLREHAAIAVPHHVAWTGADLEHHDPAYQPVWEICSVHGAYEIPDESRIPPRDDVLLEGQYLRQALDAGLVFGFVGGTDAHGLRWHHGVSRRADPLRTGLTALFAEPTREDVLLALRQRRCYATSGARILLRVELDGAPMGSEVPHPRGTLEVEAVGTAPIERLSVIQDGQEIHAVLAPRCKVSVEAHGPRSYCYVRVQQVDGEAAWSSPVWLTG